jgi:starch synthase
MKIVHVASEVFPYMKTGGLADAVGALAGSLAEKGHEVAVFLPGYRAALEHPDAAGCQRTLRLKVEMGKGFWRERCACFRRGPTVRVYLICREEYFDRRGAYGNGERDFDDNADRFIFFCKGVVEALRLGDFQADIVHCHDWQAALLPLLLRGVERRHGLTLALKTIFTIHNIAYQGLFPAKVFARTNLPDELFQMDGLGVLRPDELPQGRHPVR